ncbi:longevity assurance proteins LAG1/LAC1 [Sistotremastrum suecicum HHB10207 ss-3]|uniref:Longevity assurance proteins LAG1/LAC1 n=1 Tax=Sistotremastrum suecicum HHB10207 ss-3 TaxID=1314776 RepID=A0A166DC80_9AGAM|nr:longevity assurance proteins LAG1/LAC1 [Sistotremastrum suecicum HHB10207 ss-3]
MNLSASPSWLPPYLVPFFTLSYPSAPPSNPDSFPNSNYYRTGYLDICFVVTWIAVLAVLREVVRLGFLEPFARWWLTPRSRVASANGAHNGSLSNGKAHTNGDALAVKSQQNGTDSPLRNRKSSQSPPKLDKITKKRRKGMSKEEWARERSVLRFAEQGWACVYYTVYWTFGLYIHLSLPTSPFNTTQLWVGYPHDLLAGPLKFYYLTQMSSWLHQILVLNAEARRKDHYQMLSHHIITIILMTASYIGNFTRAGCLILALLDFCDIFLPLAKMLRYLQLTTICDATFVFFMTSWLVTRNILLPVVIWSVAFETPGLVPDVWDPEKGYYGSRGIMNLFIALLVSLQILLCIWGWMIARVAWMVVRGSSAEDVRSDEEGESPEDDTNDEAGDDEVSSNNLKRKSQ